MGETKGVLQITQEKAGLRSQQTALPLQQEEEDDLNTGKEKWVNLVEEDKIHSYGKLISMTFDVISSVWSEREQCKCLETEKNV